MARFPWMDPDPHQLRQIHDGGAPVLNLYRILANAPDMLNAWLDFAYDLRRMCKTSRRMREIMILRGAQLHDNAYEWAQHVRMAHAAGVTEAQIQELSFWRESLLFDQRTIAALNMVEQMYNGGLTDEGNAAMVSVFSDAERIELIMTAGFYTMVPAVLQAIGVDTEGEEDAECEGSIRQFDRK